MATAADYQKQLEQMGDLPDYRNVIADAYKDPIIKPITNEAQRLESQYLPTVFDTFANMGTGAGDMSAAAKLQMIGKNLGQLGSRVTTNRDVQNFFNTQIQDLANVQTQQWQQKQQRLKDLYQMAFQREEAQRRAAQAAQARAAQASQMKALMDRYKTAGGDPSIQTGSPQNLQQLNALRESKGLSPVSQDYYDNTYNPKPIPDLKMSDAYMIGVDEKLRSGNPLDIALGVASAPGALLIKGAGSILGF